jgi:hypothetical protein
MTSLASLGSVEESRKRIAWANTLPVMGRLDVRMDCDGRHIMWGEYGRLTEYGWEIDHIRPTILGGPDVAGNIRARHWRGNRSAGGILGGLMDLGRKGY